MLLHARMDLGSVLLASALVACGPPREARTRAIDLLASAGDLAAQETPDLAELALDLGAPLDLSETVDLWAPPDLSRPYPPGPYGSDVGSTAPNLKFQGYFSPRRIQGLATADPYGEVSFDQLRTSGAKYALIVLAGFT